MTGSTRSIETRWSQRRRLTIVLCLNAGLIVGLVLVGVLAHSVSVLAAAGDTIGDCLGLGLGLVAVVLHDRDPDHPHAQRFIAGAALINSCLLILVAASVVAESVTRLLAGSPPVSGLPVIIVSVITMLVMLTGALVLGRSAAVEDVHMRSVLLDALADAAAAAGVVVAGGIILLAGGLYWLDPVMALVISAVIAVAAARLMITAIASLRGRGTIVFDDD